MTVSAQVRTRPQHRTRSSPGIVVAIGGAREVQPRRKSEWPVNVLEERGRAPGASNHVQRKMVSMSGE